MSDKIDPEWTVELGRERRACFDLRAVKAIEKTLNRSIYAVLRDWERVGVTETIVFLWAALLTDDKQLTLSEVEDLVPLAQVTKFYQEMTPRLVAAFSTGEEEAKGEQGDPEEKK